MSSKFPSFLYIFRHRSPIRKHCEWYERRGYSACKKDDKKPVEKPGYFSNNCWPKDPVKIFQQWVCDATRSKPKPYPILMCLATAPKCGIPSARMMTITEFCEQGFVFFTSYYSEKARELDENPYCALNVWWQNRQVRVQGCAAQFPDELNAKYFEIQTVETRMASHLKQSQPVKDKQAIINEMIEMHRKYKPPKKIPRPCNWGGYIIRPFSFEFYEHRNDRIHDRVRFRRAGAEVYKNVDCDSTMHWGECGWVYEFLTP